MCPDFEDAKLYKSKLQLAANEQGSFEVNVCSRVPKMIRNTPKKCDGFSLHEVFHKPNSDPNLGWWCKSWTGIHAQIHWIWQSTMQKRLSAFDWLWLRRNPGLYLCRCPWLLTHTHKKDFSPSLLLTSLSLSQLFLCQRQLHGWFGLTSSGHHLLLQVDYLTGQFPTLKPLTG